MPDVFEGTAAVRGARFVDSDLSGVTIRSCVAAAPGYEDVLPVRVARMALVRERLAGLDDDDFARVVTRSPRPRTRTRSAPSASASASCWRRRSNTAGT